MPNLDPWTLLAGVLLTTVPLGVGAACARRWPLRVLAPVWLAVLGLAVPATLFLPWLNPAEIVVASLLALVGAAIGGARSASERLGVILGLALFLALAEGGARVRWVPSPFPGHPGIAVDLGQLSPRCTFRAAVHWRWQPEVHPRVIHLGDSMIDTYGSQRSTVLLLDAADPGVRHVEAGLGFTGPECALLLLRDAPAAELYVYHLFLANDLEDLSRGYVWCDEGPLLEPTLPLRYRCAPDASPRRLSLSGRLFATPLPWLLRALRPVSALAVGLSDTWETLRVVPKADQDRARHAAAQPWALLEASLAALREEATARGAGFVVVLAPISPEHEAEVFDPEPRPPRARALLDRLGLPYVDGSTFLVDQRAAGTPPEVLHPWPGDFHLSDEGHRRYADWLRPRLEPWVAPLRPAPAP